MKDLQSNSWTVVVKKLLFKFHLPSIYDLLCDTPEKDAWKRKVKDVVHQYYLTSLPEEIKDQTS